MIIKKKSLVVVLVSGFLISAVLILTLIGYVIYVELKDEESKMTYQESLKSIKSEINHENTDRRNAAR